MPRLVAVTVLLAALLGCGAFGSAPIPPQCDDRRGWWPDEDSDGVGDDGAVVYVGCDPPEGWVDVPPRPADTDAPADTDESDDTEPAPDTDDSADSDAPPETDAPTDG